MAFTVLILDFMIVWLFICTVETVMPWLTPPSVQFGVRVPPDKIGSAEVREPRKSYVVVQLIIAAATGILFILIPAYAGLETLAIGLPFAVIIPSFLNYLRARHSLLARKEKENWFAGVTQERFVEIEDGGEPRVNYLYALPALAIFAATIIVGISIYPSLPQVLPVHFGASGQPDGFAPKSSLAAFAVIIVQAITISLFLIIASAVVRTRRSIESQKPMTSLWQQNKFKSLSANLLLLMSFFVGLSLMLAQLNIWGLLPHSLSLLDALPSLVGVLGLTIPMMRAGQYGSRIMPPAPEKETGVANVDDDREWKAGAVYYNRGDRAILVPKRFGVGWTFNFANPISWIILAVLLLLPVILLIIIRLMH